MDDTVSGTVTDQNGQPLPGASVRLKDAATGVITDDQGKFTLDVPDNGTLVISNIGFTTAEVPVNGRKSITIALTGNARSLAAVTVNVGYTTQKKTSVTAAVSTLQVKDINNIATANVTNSLSGRIAGVIGAQASGEIGSDGSEIHIRGIGTTGNNAPLVVVDGIPRSMSSVNPNQIESVTVLKDAAAVAPYGIAGANGVILVTTKRGKAGPPTFSYNGYVSWSNPITLPKMLNAYQYATLRNVADKNAGSPVSFTDADIAGYKKTVEGAPGADPDKYPNTDAYKALLNRNVPMTQHNLQVSGGTDKIKYYMGLSYLHQGGLLGDEHLDRYNFVGNTDAQVTKTTLVSVSISGYNSRRNRPQDGDGNPFANAQAYLPISAVNYSNGLLASSNGKLLRPGIELGNRLDDNTAIMTQLSISQDLPFIPGLSIKQVVSYDPEHDFSKSWTEASPTYYMINTSTSPYTYDPVANDGRPSLSEAYSKGTALESQSYINYHQVFGNHDITALLVMDARKYHNDNFSASRSNYDLNIDELSLGSPIQTNWGNGGGSGDTRQVGYLYQLNYAFKDKYLLGATGRYDGSYVFAPGHRYGFFPAFSAGWRISEEPFIKDRLTWIDNLKLRGSYGESGNLVGPDQWSSSMSITGAAYVMDGKTVQGANERVEPNPFITWERAKKADIGLEGVLWRGLLGFEVDYFYEKRNNMLVSPNSTIPTEYGIGIAQINAGKMDNHGIDVTLSSYHAFSNGLTLDISGTFSYAQNKLVQTFENAATYNDPVRRRTGRPLNEIFALKALGLFKTSDDKNGDGQITADDGFPTQFGSVAPGDIRYQDTNGDGHIDVSDEVPLGNSAIPPVQFGFNPRISYKGFDLNLFFQGATGGHAILNGELVFPFYTGANSSTAVLDYWTPDHQDAAFPRPFGQGGNTNNTQLSSWYLRRLDYLRLKSLEFGYTLPTAVVNRIKLQNVRIYLSGTNLKTWDNLDGLVDPEFTQAGTSNTANSNQRGWSYPFVKTFSAGIAVTF
ncbi:TonB-dependent receptor [Compostibacter hankyongensis]|uniref:TonB-dependent receptor n=1 Tax=Compostibacter hankyongensis TaxID=1007089 RepID=A0ABP8G1A3_9BACT